MAAPLFFLIIVAHQGAGAYGANPTMAGETDNFHGPAKVSAAASINVPGAPLTHRAVPIQRSNVLMFISFIYSTSVTQAKCQAVVGTFKTQSGASYFFSNARINHRPCTNS
jgi:hypothetical protein